MKVLKLIQELSSFAGDKEVFIVNVSGKVLEVTGVRSGTFDNEVDYPGLNGEDYVALNLRELPKMLVHIVSVRGDGSPMCRTPGIVSNDIRQVTCKSCKEKYSNYMGDFIAWAETNGY